VKNPQVLVGLAVSVVCGYIAVHGVEWSAVGMALGRVNLFTLLPATGCLGLFFVLRACRWQRLVEPLRPLPFRPFWLATLIGFMANDILPLRMGELVRAYALAHLTLLRLSSALATTVLERIWDAIMIGLLLIVTLSGFPLPPWLARANLIILAASGIALIGGWGLVRYRVEKFSWIPPGLAALLANFSGGLQSLHSVSILVRVSFLSLAIWLTLALYYWVLLRGCGFVLPVQAALMVTVVTALGVALPAAPGFVGTFQYATILALSFFSIPKEEALAFSLVAHVLQLVPVIVAGLIALARSGLPLWPAHLIGTRKGTPKDEMGTAVNQTEKPVNRML
jgi:uncharacterized membrane protein YbhN (UPF0104 family)